jgi:hypothetical protein
MLSMNGARPRAPWLVVCLAGVPLWPSLSRADVGNVQACVTAAEDGQKLRDGGSYAHARERFIVCAGDGCPGEVRRSCVGWLGELEKVTPTVVFGAQARGGEIADVRVSLDGTLVAERIDGKPIPVDPGAHRFRFEHAGDDPVDQTTVVRAGEKERLISVRFGPEPALISPSPASRPSPPPPTSRTSAYVLGAVGLASLAAGAVLDLSGYAFLQQCNSDTSCTGSHERAEVEWRFVTGDLLLGAGLACGALAWFVASHDSHAAAFRPTTIGGLRVSAPRAGTPPGLILRF